MTDRVIEQADQALEASIIAGRPKQKEQDGKIALMAALLEADRDVNKIVARYTSRQPPPARGKLETSSTLLRKPISKYNYYGRQYRWEEREMEMEVSKADVVEVSKSEMMIRQPIEKEDMLTVQNEDRLKVKQDKEDSLFMHREEVAIPSHQYYIMFDQKRAKIKEKFTRSNKLNTTEPFGFYKPNNPSGDTLKGPTDAFPQTSPAWFLERKVVALEKEVGRLRSTGKTKGKDQRVSMRQVDRLIQNLFK